MRAAAVPRARGARVVVAASAALFALLGARGRVDAHTGTATFGAVAVVGGDVTWTLRLNIQFLAGPEVGVGLAPGAGVRDAFAHEAAIEAYLARGLAVARGGAPCPLGDRALSANDAASTTVVVRFRFACPATGSIALRYDLFFALDALHASYTKIDEGDGGATTIVFRARERAATLAASSPWQSARAYLVLGVEHIFTGYDHLAFLAALLLATGLARRSRGAAAAEASATRPALREVLKIVTAFTAAHSTTLILATLHPGLVPTAWVEPAIAASIAYVGIENLVARAPRRRWPLVFAFGLVHGLGFSSVLREIGLPTRGLVLSLLAFNVGVELGQLAVVSLVLPPVLLAARRDPVAFERRGLRLGSAAIAVAGVVWFVARVF